MVAYQIKKKIGKHTLSHQKDRSLDLIDSSATERIDTNEESIDKDEFEKDRDDVDILKNLSSSL